jgi:hypothetical protein
VEIEDLLKEGDRRSLGKSQQLVLMIDQQKDFDLLFSYLFDQDRKVVMRAADAIEKITRQHPDYLKTHQKEILSLCKTASHIELKWHLALLVARLSLSTKELGLVWQLLTQWLLNRKESRIVRVNALQSLFDLVKYKPELRQDLNHSLVDLAQENIPSINARLRKLLKQTPKIAT